MKFNLSGGGEEKRVTSGFGLKLILGGSLFFKFETIKDSLLLLR